MSKRKAIITAVVAIIALAAVPFIYAQTAGRHHAGGLMFGHFNRIRAALGLTDDQVAQLKTIREDLRTQNAPYREQMKGGFAAIAHTLLKDPDNIDGAQALINEQTSARKAMQVNILNAASKALKVLTPDQRAKAAEFLQQRMAMQEQRMQRHDH